MKPLLVGESNPYQQNEEDAMRYALYPEPVRASGWRLCRVVMGLDPHVYLRAFDRVDLCHPTWSLPLAQRKAQQLVAERSDDDVIVLCGAKVAGAFGVAYVPHSVTRGRHYDGIFHPYECGPRIIVLPHPSGLNRAWHQPDAVELARQTLRACGVLPLQLVL